MQGICGAKSVDTSQENATRGVLQKSSRQIREYGCTALHCLFHYQGPRLVKAWLQDVGFEKVEAQVPDTENTCPKNAAINSTSPLLISTIFVS